MRARQEVRTAAAARAAGWDSCIVVNDRRVVLGRLRLDRIDEASLRPVEEVMDPGPATVRAHAELETTRERLRPRELVAIRVPTREEEAVRDLCRARPT